MEIIRGAPALSAFRVQKLMQACEAAQLPVKQIYAEYVHLAYLSEALNPDDQAQLSKILTYGPAIESHEPQGTLLFVTPRPGTISPWSSKATDIAQNCGLKQVKRLERGLAYYVESDALSSEQLKSLKALLHDRMMEVVLDSFEAADVLFARTEPSLLSASTFSAKAAERWKSPTAKWAWPWPMMKSTTWSPIPAP